MVLVKELTKKLKDNNYNTTVLNEEELDLLCRLDSLRPHMLLKRYDKKLCMFLYRVTNMENDEEFIIYEEMFGNHKKVAAPIDVFMGKVDDANFMNIINITNVG